MILKKNQTDQSVSSALLKKLVQNNFIIVQLLISTFKISSMLLAYLFIITLLSVKTNINYT